MGTIEQIRAELHSLRNPSKAEIVKKYLKSDYSFYGITVPQLRKIAKQFKDLNKEQVYKLFDELWSSGNHEEMSLALYILGNLKKQFSLDTWTFLFTNQRMEKAKSWDHIDEISSHITGEIFLHNPNLQPDIKKLSDSRNSWMRRLSIVSQYPCIKKGKIQLTLLLAEKLVYDDDIYVQKGAGWMLREAAKKNPSAVAEFIKIHKNMKAAAFSYATEKMLPLRKKLKEEIKQEKIHGKEKMFEMQNEGEKEKEKNNLQEECKNTDNKLVEQLKKIKYFKN
jgi:3-methyladenine DNA glycosylase AlkD